MARRSSIKKLPEDVQELIGKLRAAGRSLDEIMEKLRELDITVSRSALGRHAKTLEEVIARRNNVKMTAQALAENFGDKPVSEIRRANQELIELQLNELLMTFDADKPFGGDPKNAAHLSMAHQRATKSAALDQARVIELKAHMKAEAVKAVDKVAKEAEGGKLDGAAVLKRIREEVYGIFDKPVGA